MTKNKGQNVKMAWWQPALQLFARLSVWIVAPVIIALFLGKWLDRKFDSAPWLFIVTVGFAFTISMVGVVIDTTREMARISKEINDTGIDKNKSSESKS